MSDRKNAIILELRVTPSPQVAASLQAALKNAIQVEFDDSDNNTVAISDNDITRSGEHGIQFSNRTEVHD